MVRKSLLCLVLGLCAAAGAQTFTATLPEAPSHALEGQDGNLYILMISGNLGIVTPAGSYSQVGVPSLNVPLCLQTTSGLFIARATSYGAYLYGITPTGEATALTNFAAYCPVAASDGNYYGGYNSGGTYKAGYLYQITATGTATVFYNFTGTVDGDGPLTPLVQASDGNLYGISAVSSQTIFRYSPTTGVSVIATLPASDEYSENLVQGADGNLYTAGAASSNGEYQLLDQVTLAGNVTALSPTNTSTTPDYGPRYLLSLAPLGNGYLAEFGGSSVADSDDCDNGYASLTFSTAGQFGTEGFDTAGGLESSGTMVPAGNGGFYVVSADTPSSPDSEDGGCYEGTTTYSAYTLPLSTTPSIAVSLSKTHVRPGNPSTLSWQVNGAESLTAQQCYAYGPGWTGKQALSGSLTVTPSAAGTQTYALQCGGTLTNAVQLVAGPAVLSLTTSATTIVPGVPIELTATVTNVGTPAPTGNVGFYSGATLLGTVALNSSGVAVFAPSTASVPLGTYSVTAKYAGDTNYGPAVSSAISIAVAPVSASSVVISVSPSPVLLGGSAILSATVTGGSTYTSPTGTVTFYYGTEALGTTGISGPSQQTQGYGSIRLTASGIPAGTYPIYGKYSGNGYDGPATSNTLDVQVVSDMVTVTASPTTVPANTSFSLAATVNGESPTGTVIFYAGSTAIGTGSLSSGTVTDTFTPGTLAAGTYSITAKYEGDSKNPATTSPAISLTVD